MVTGSGMKEFGQVFGVKPGKSIPGLTIKIVSQPKGSILWPNDKAVYVFQIENTTGSDVVAKGKFFVINYGTKGQPGDIWVPQVVKFGDVGSVPISLNIPAKGYQNITVKPTIPEKFGGYALVLDLGTMGRQFVTTCVRTFKPNTGRVKFPRISLDDIGIDALQRLGIHAIRWGVSYQDPSDNNYGEMSGYREADLKRFNDANITVLAMIGGGGFTSNYQPMKVPRPWLDKDGKMGGYPFDLAWLPSYDADFTKYVTKLATDWGWPKGPITAFSLWNEPWEGCSVSGWGADLPRYREIYKAMADGVLAARKNGADVLVGGCDSSSNALDKIFNDNKDEFMPIFDFLSIHYQGLNSYSTYKPWRDRKASTGRVKIWDTESWIANTDDRVAGVMASNLAAGYDRAMGVYGGNVAERQEYEIKNGDKTYRVNQTHAFSTAAAIGAATHFIGDRPFRQLLFRNGLPWVMVFDGIDNPDDGTVVIVGDLGEEYGARNLPLRTARGIAEMKRKEALWKQFRATTDPSKISKLRAQIEKDEVLSEASLTVPANAAYKLYDFYGNPASVRGNKIAIPLDGKGFFFRPSGAKGSFNKLIKALQASDIVGIQPFAIVAHDMTAPIDQKPTLRLKLTNVLNKTVTGKLKVNLGRLQLEVPKGDIVVKGNETKEIEVKIAGGKAEESNSYPLSVEIETSKGRAVLYEDLHCNVISKKTINVDGNLGDWEGSLPQLVLSPEGSVPSLTEAAWYPFKSFDKTVSKGVATGFVAADDQYFYFASKVADDTPEDGMMRIETRDDDQFYYPDKSYSIEKVDGKEKRVDHVWPEGVRHYSYRKDPFLPAGNAQPWCDNVQIAFNVLPPEMKLYDIMSPGTMPGFVNYQCTDYEFALNPIAPKYGGGTEIWKLNAPELPHKHYYPRQNKADGEGPVKDGKLVVRRDGNTIITECAIPWTQMPWVKKRLDAGQTVKFSFRSNNNVNGTCMELSRMRSVSKSGPSFMVDWVEHWSNELEFGLERK